MNSENSLMKDIIYHKEEGKKESQENSRQISEISFDGFTMSVGRQDLHQMLNLNSQGDLTHSQTEENRDSEGDENFLNTQQIVNLVLECEETTENETNSDQIELTSQEMQEMRDLFKDSERKQDERVNRQNEADEMNSDSDKELVAAMDQALEKFKSTTRDHGFVCSHCNKKFLKKNSLTSHMKTKHGNNTFSCNLCFVKSFNLKGNRNKHEKRCRGIRDEDNSLDCQLCGKQFSTYYNKTRHEKICMGPTSLCDICGKKYSSSGRLRKHRRTHDRKYEHNQNPRNHSNNPEPFVHTSQEPGPSHALPRCPPQPSYRCRECGERFDNRRELRVHGMRTHYQVGQGLQTRPWGNDPAPWEFEGGEIDESLRFVYETNEPLILEPHQRGPIESRYNLPLQNNVTVQQMVNFADEIYQDQQYAFRLNLVFGVILQNRETGEYRYFVPYSNNQIFDEPIFISKRSDLRKLQRGLQRKDILTELLRNRPDTKWIPVLVTQVVFRVTSTHFPIGQGQELPQYLLNKKSLYALVRNAQTRRTYDDNLCAFRCLALHKGYDIRNLEKPTEEFYNQWISYTRPCKQFHGLAYEEIPEFESFFKINVEIYSLQEDDSCRSIYKSRSRFDSTMYLNLYENHFSYIINFAKFAKKFQCKTCDRNFSQVYNLKLHEKTCCNKTKLVYPGGHYKPYETIFDKLEQIGIHVAPDQRSYEWFACFDFESILEHTDEQSSDYLHWTQKHIPISVSICSNVDGYTEPLCIVETDQEKLVGDMVTALQEIAEKVKEMAESKWGWVLETIKNNLEEEKNKDAMEKEEEEEEEEEKEEEQKETRQNNSIEQIYGQFIHYITQLPVLGFNSAKYDCNLIKRHLAKHLNFHSPETKAKFVIKKNNSYTCLSSYQLKFLDITQFLAVGTSYSSFLKAYKVEENKGFFPYEWFDSVEKLTYPELPPHKTFYSSLKNQNISAQQYAFCQRIWEENHMQNFQDFLVWYNNNDTYPFTLGLSRLQQFYFNKGIDVFKTAISVPGIARQLLFKAAQECNANFALCDKKSADLYQTIKSNIIGGPSIIFHRHMQAGKSKIRGGKLCKKILGWDANALYLECIGKPMPVGPFIRRMAPEFKPEVRDKYMVAYFWMDYLIKTQGSNIIHRLNHGKEVRVGGYLVDGYQAGPRPTVYQFHGCYFHGHKSCSVTWNIKDKKWLETRESKYNKTKEITEHLKRKGCEVIEMWECQFENFKKQNPNIKTFINEHRPQFYQYHKGTVTEEEILQNVVDGTLFGMVEVDIEVPQNWPKYLENTKNMTPYQYFEEMSPLFCTCNIPFSNIGKHMQDHVKTHNLSTAPRKLLVGGMKGRQMLIATPLLKWYLEHGMVVTKIYQVVEFQQQRCFKSFVQEVSDARRQGDADKDTSIIADTMKLIGCSGYGSLIMDKTKHREIDYVQGENKTCLKVNEPRFRQLECLEEIDQIYEIEMAKRKINLDLPIQLGYFILQYAKLRMLEFYYDFMDKYVDRSDFQYMEMDTDSAYMAISGSCLDEIIKPEMRTKYQHGLKGFCNEDDIEADNQYHWFQRSCCKKHTTFDKRTPGLFKLEYQGDEMIGLCSKTYIVRKLIVKYISVAGLLAYKLLRKAKMLKPKRLNKKPRITNEYKFSSKGISKQNVKVPMSIFRHVIKTGKSRSGTNRGFRVRKNTIFTYTQVRQGFSYFYCKRRVLEDGIHTVPLDITLCPLLKNDDVGDASTD